MAANYNNISRFLNSLNFHFPPEWLSECLDYYKTNQPNISESDLKEEVKQQWLLANLRDWKVSVFPPNLKTSHKTILNGKYACQVETMIDSGQSRYSQMQSLRNQLSDNVKATTKKSDDDLPARRCLTMTITDGIQDLRAMEYEVIPSLKLNDPDLLPGFKMVISGPVVCRKGMILLSAKNVQVFGGEVEDLIEKNTLEALLMGSLGMERSDAAHRRDTAPLVDPTPRRDTTPLRDTVPVRDAAPRRDTVPVRDTALMRDRIEEPEIVNLLEDNDDFLFNLPMEAENIMTSTQAPQRDDDYFVNIPDDIVELEKSISSNPFVYLAQICKPNTALNRIYKIKAVILTLKSKIAVKGDKFTLRAKISDGSLAIDVDFSSDVLENLLGFDPSEMSQMVKEKKKNFAIAEQLKNAFVGAQNKLIALNSILHVKFIDRDSLPVVLSLEDVNRRHLTEMNARKI